MKLLILSIVLSTISFANQKDIKLYFKLNNYEFPWDVKDTIGKSDSLYGHYYFRLAYVFINNNKDSADFYYNKSYELIEKSNLEHLKGHFLFNKSIYYGLSENIEESVESLLQAESIAIEYKDSLLLAKIYTNLSLVWYNLEDDTRYLEYFNKAIKLNSSQGLIPNNIQFWQQYYNIICTKVIRIK